jgi:heat shock protein HtpX
MLFAIAKNKFKTSILVLCCAAFLALAIYFISVICGIGEFAIYIAFGITLITTLFSYFFSSKIVIKTSHAVPMAGMDEQRVGPIIHSLCRNNGLVQPQLYIVEDMSPNAFATGRNPKNAIVCVTRGLLNVLDDRELEGVLAHEMSHIKNYDILLSTVAAIMLGVVITLSRIGGRGMLRGRSNRNGGSLIIIALIAMILAPIAATLLRLAISRNREFLADATAASLTRNPNALADALEKLELSSQGAPAMYATEGTANMYIVNPFAGIKASKLFRTHPSTFERVAALRNIAN